MMRTGRMSGRRAFYQGAKAVRCLAVVLDLHSRQVVGWSMQSRMQASLVTDALRIPGRTDRIRYAKLNEPQRELLGQCANGKLVGIVGGRQIVRHAV